MNEAPKQIMVSWAAKGKAVASTPVSAGIVSSIPATEYVRRDLAQAPAPVRVKGLQWQDDGQGGFIAKGVARTYNVHRLALEPGTWGAVGVSDTAPNYDTVKDACERDNTARIIAALEAPAPVLWTQAQQLAFARAYDTEDAAQRGEPTPWVVGEDAGEWVDERLGCVRAGLAALESPDADQTNMQKVHNAPDAGVVAELVEALRVFAKAADALNDGVPDAISLGIFAEGALRFGPDFPSVADLRAARAALAKWSAK